MEPVILFGMLIATYLMVIAKRTPVLIRGFRYQSIALFLVTLVEAFRGHHGDLYGIAALLFTLKVIAIPYFLSRIVKEIRANENLGMTINAQLSLVAALALTYGARSVTGLLDVPAGGLSIAITVAFSVTLAGMFLMTMRMTAIAQIIGLLTMENGLFLLAASVAGGMPFFVEIAVFFDVFVSVIILGIFVYRINRLFTHIDVTKLSHLRG